MCAGILSLFGYQKMMNDELLSEVYPKISHSLPNKFTYFFNTKYVFVMFVVFMVERAIHYGKHSVFCSHFMNK